MIQNANISIFHFLRFCTKTLIALLLYHLRVRVIKHAPQNEHLNLSFVKDNHIVGKKMARYGCKMAIYELPFFVS